MEETSMVRSGMQHAPNAIGKVRLMVLLAFACGIAGCAHRAHTSSGATRGSSQQRSQGTVAQHDTADDGKGKGDAASAKALSPGEDILPTGEPSWERPWRVAAAKNPKLANPFAPGCPNYRPRAVWKDDAECRHNLESIGAAVNRYRRDHGRKPASLWELYPKYVSSVNVLACPYMRPSKVTKSYTYEYTPCGVTSDQGFQVLCETHFLLLGRDGVLYRVVR